MDLPMSNQPPIGAVSYQCPVPKRPYETDQFNPNPFTFALPASPRVAVTPVQTPTPTPNRFAQLASNETKTITTQRNEMKYSFSDIERKPFVPVTRHEAIHATKLLPKSRDVLEGDVYELLDTIAIEP